MAAIDVRAKINRLPVHHSITEEQISDLVDGFYEKVHAHDRLGRIFDDQITGNWDAHLSKMKSFWRSVLLRSGEYKGKPVPVHQMIEGIVTGDFVDWLKIFSETTSQIFDPEAAVLIDQAAHRIASSLWLSRSTDPFVAPPDWNQIIHTAAWHNLDRNPRGA